MIGEVASGRAILVMAMAEGSFVSAASYKPCGARDAAALMAEGRGTPNVLCPCRRVLSTEVRAAEKRRYVTT